MKYETTYLIVAGIVWIRRTQLGDDATIWVTTFEPEPEVRTADAGDATIWCGNLGGLSWAIRDHRELAPPFRSPHPPFARIAASKMETSPASLFTGFVAGREFQNAPGHSAVLTGRRHASSWGWAHTSGPDGSWTHLLTAKLPGLPRLSQHGTRARPPRLPFARGSVDPPRVHVGPYTVEADPESFVGLRYTDTDGSTFWCYHSESALGLGPYPTAMEIATREPIPEWKVGA
jgi:hypothetical protein